jgi:hypothetical protein
MFSKASPTNRLIASAAVASVLTFLPIGTSTGTAMAQDCNSAGSEIRLRSQGHVDDFQSTYGPCDRVGGSLDILTGEGMEPITDLSPLEDLVEVGEFLWVQGSMTNLNGLHNLVSVGDIFTITGSTLLTDLTGLTSLQSAGSLELRGLTSLTSLSGMPNLSTVGSFTLSDLAFLPNLTGLPAAVDIESLGIRNSELSSLDGAPVMSNLRLVELRGTGLTDLSGLSSSSFVPVGVGPGPGGPSIDISSNFQLTNLVGLPVGEKFGLIQISDNPALTSLAGLESLVEVWSFLQIQNNDFLADCSMLVKVLDEVDDGDPGPCDGCNPDDPPDSPGLGGIQISSNGEDLPPEQSACNSIEEILASAAPTPIHKDGFESATL